MNRIALNSIASNAPARTRLPASALRCALCGGLSLVAAIACSIALLQLASTSAQANVRAAVDGVAVGRASSQAATAFLASLDAEQRKLAQLSYDDAERRNWHYVPRSRRGLALAAMNADQRAAAHRLLRSTLSTGGYLKATSIMLLDRVLHDMARARGRSAPYRDAEKYWFTIFGDPKAQQRWGWRVEGHHLSLNFAFDGERCTSTPVFLGANPELVREGPHAGLAVLSREEEVGRRLLESLTPEQRARATIAAEAPSDVIYGPGRELDAKTRVGIPGRELNETQRALLRAIPAELRANFSDATPAPKIDVDELTFGWAGSHGPSERAYYRVQSPNFVIEFDRTEAGPPGHVHVLWRDENSDFGANLLASHRRQYHQPMRSARTTDDAPPAEIKPKKQLKLAAQAMARAKSHHTAWRFDIGTADAPDHKIDFTAFFQEYDAHYHADRMEVPALELYRVKDRGVIRGLRGWQSDKGHIVGKWIAVLLQHPSQLLATARRANKPVVEKSPFGPRLRIPLTKKQAAAQWARVVQSRCLAGHGEDIPQLLSRVDATRMVGEMVVAFAKETGAPRDITITVAIRLAAKNSSQERGDAKEDFREREHLVVRHHYKVSRLGEVDPIEIPAEALKLLR